MSKVVPQTTTGLTHLQCHVYHVRTRVHSTSAPPRPSHMSWATLCSPFEPSPLLAAAVELRLHCLLLLSPWLVMACCLSSVSSWLCTSVLIWNMPSCDTTSTEKYRLYYWFRRSIEDLLVPVITSVPGIYVQSTSYIQQTKRYIM